MDSISMKDGTSCSHAKQNTSAQFFWYRIAGISFFVFFLLLLISGLWSGYRYMFDLDEINHVQRAYLINEGGKPFITYYSIYTPLYQWIILPFLKIFGYTMETLQILRVASIGVFLLRMYLTYYIVKRLFGRLASYIAVTLLLLDPFTIFSGMQVRPDNLMLLLVELGIAFFIQNTQKTNRTCTLCSGVCFGLSLLIHIKIFPVVFAILCVELFYVIRAKRTRQLSALIAGVLMPIAAYVVYSVFDGTFVEMIRQTIIEPAGTLGNLMYPAHVGEFYRPNNVNLFGVSGKPLSWVFLWMFPPLGFAGAYLAFQKYVLHSTKDELWKVSYVGMITCALIAQWISLFPLSSVFIQYYLPLSWMYAMFGGYVVSDLIDGLARNGKIGNMIIVFLFGLFAVFAVVTVRNNVSRAKFSGESDIAIYKHLWTVIPPDASVYPRLLFRPSGHPLGTAQFYPELSDIVRKRYGPVEDILEKEKVSYLVISYYELDKMGSAFREYVQDHYRKVPEEVSVYRRIDDGEL